MQNLPQIETAETTLLSDSKGYFIDKKINGSYQLTYYERVIASSLNLETILTNYNNLINKRLLTVFFLLVCFVSGFAGSSDPLHIYSERFNTSLNVARSSYQFEYKGLTDLKEYAFNTYLEVNELLLSRDAEIIKGLNKNEIYREYRKRIVIIENSVFWKPE